jgi:hypothetical protein
VVVTVNKTLTLAALIAVVLFAGAITYATADTAIVYGTGGASQTASDTVTVKATVLPMLTLTVATPDNTQTVDFGAVDPGTAYGPKPVSVTVQSNKTYNISKTTTGAAPIGLTTTLGNSTNNARTSGQLYTDNYSINAPWTTDPGSYAATVQYTVVQN